MVLGCEAAAANALANLTWHTSICTTENPEEPYSPHDLKLHEKFGNTFDGVTILVISLLLGCQQHLLSLGVILSLPHVDLQGAELSAVQPEIVGCPFIQRWTKGQVLSVARMLLSNADV